MFILFSFLLLIILKGFSKEIIKDKNFERLFYFLIITIFINSIYAVIHFNFDFIISSSHYVFGILTTYLTIFTLAKSNYKDNLLKILVLTLFLLVFLWNFGLGDYKFLPRYNGFFNDPNQMAHWALCTLAMIFLLNDKNNFLNYTSLILTTIIILVSLSRSGLMGLSFVIFALIIPSKKNIIVISFLLISLLIFLFSINISENKIYESYENITTRLSDSDFNEQADTRGYNRAFQYPEYLIFGSGQGEDYRFNSDVEIHSTWMGILFYYGFFTFCYFIYFLYQLLRNLKLIQIGVIMGPLIYGFSTFGLRTPIFWLMLGVIIFKSKTAEEKSKYKFVNIKNL
jgi:hypothetical protein